MLAPADGDAVQHVMIIAVREAQFPPDQLVSDRQLLARLAILRDPAIPSNWQVEAMRNLQPIERYGSADPAVDKGLYIQGRQLPVT